MASRHETRNYWRVWVSSEILKTNDIQGTYPLQDCYPQLERKVQVIEQQELGNSLAQHA